MVDYLRGTAQYFGTHPFIINLILVIGMSVTLLGFDELKRSGHKKVRRNLLICLTLLLISLFILSYASIRLHWKITGKDFADIYWFIPFCLLAMSSFPLALYLNHRQQKSTTPPATDNAS
jgi:membrane-associated HD superfamily phosphohydrolase